MSVVLVDVQTKEGYRQILQNQSKVNEKIANYLKKTNHNKKV